MSNVTYEIFENLCKIIDIPFNVTDCNLKLSTGKAPVIELTKIIEDCKNLEEKKEKFILVNKNEVIKSSASLLGDVESYSSNFIEELELLSKVLSKLDSKLGLIHYNGVTHCMLAWSLILSAKAKQLRKIFKENE